MFDSTSSSRSPELLLQLSEAATEPVATQSCGFSARWDFPTQPAQPLRDCVYSEVASKLFRG
jgi:hypothetical protein